MNLTASNHNNQTITLRPVDRDNWREVAKLKVSEAQSEFVAEPLYYLVAVPLWRHLEAPCHLPWSAGHRLYDVG